MATATQEQIVRLAPFQEEFLADIFESAKGLTGEGTQMPFAEQQLADLSQGQQQAIQVLCLVLVLFNLFYKKVVKHWSRYGQRIWNIGVHKGCLKILIQHLINNLWILLQKMLLQQHKEDIARQGAQQQNQIRCRCCWSRCIWWIKTRCCCKQKLQEMLWINKQELVHN